MLGSSAAGLFWMFRYLERCENTARLIEAGLRIGLTGSGSVSGEWRSVLKTSGVDQTYLEKHGEYDAEAVIDFLLRDNANHSSLSTSIEAARTNGRRVRAMLTREVWEATNEAWMLIQEALDRPVDRSDLPAVLALVRRETAYVRGALHGTMTRNESYDFCRLGTFLERADNTARILDVKYYVLLPSARHVGSSLDNVQWENILRSISAQRAYRWRNPGDINPSDIAEFVIFDPHMPRSLAFCYQKIYDKLDYLARTSEQRHPCHDQAAALRRRFVEHNISSVFEMGLHEFLQECITETAGIAHSIETDYRFAR